MRSYAVTTRGGTRRVWEEGEGTTVVYLAGPFGLPRWSSFLAALAEHHRVVAPSLPGYPGGGSAEELDDTLDWITATLDVLDAVGAPDGALVGHSVGGALAAEVAAVSPTVERLVLISPLGINASDDPIRNHLGAFERRPELLSIRGADVAAQLERPPDVDELDWRVERARALATNARILWPLLDTGVAKRLHRIRVPTLILWGEEDRLVPARYASRFADAISGPTQVELLPEAGHLADLDAPVELAQRIVKFLAAAEAGR